VLVNAAAILVLGGGFLVLSLVHGKEEVRFRESPAAYNPAERALIDEIRRETNSRLEAKEGEISFIMSKLSGVDSELQNLQSSVESMSMESLASKKEAELRISNLQKLQDEYRVNLSTLQNERSQILEASRAREASLHAQLEARTRELNAVSEQGRAELGSARSELERLSAEQERAAVIEGQLGGYYRTVLNHVRGGRPGEAAAAVEALREFLGSPAFSGSPAALSRREIYLAAANALDALIREAQRPAALSGGDAAQTLAALQERNARLEESVAELNRTIAAYNSRGSDLDRQMSETEGAAAALRTLNQSLQQQVDDREQTIAGLQSQSAAQSEIIAARDARIGELQAANAAQTETIANLNTQLESIRQALQALSQ
jgi:chromosome segregation ATPase